MMKTVQINVWIFASLLLAVSSSAANPLAANPSEVGCIRTSTGNEYTGNQNVSSSGRPCVRWDSLVGAFRDHIKMLFITMPERNAASAQNFCRNPNNDQRGLWCFVSQLGTVQFCSVPKCATFGSTTHKPARRATTQSSTSLLRNDGGPWSRDDPYSLTSRDFQNDQASDDGFINVNPLYGEPYESQSLMEQRSTAQEEMWPNDRPVTDNDDRESLLSINFRHSVASQARSGTMTLLFLTLFARFLL